MRINNAFKRAANRSWCQHTDNNFGWRNHKAVRAGKRFLRKKFKNFLLKEFRNDSENTVEVAQW